MEKSQEEEKRGVIEGRETYWEEDRYYLIYFAGGLAVLLFGGDEACCGAGARKEKIQSSPWKFMCVNEWN